MKPCVVFVGGVTGNRKRTGVMSYFSCFLIAVSYVYARGVPCSPPPHNFGFKVVVIIRGGDPDGVVAGIMRETTVQYHRPGVFLALGGVDVDCYIHRCT